MKEIFELKLLRFIVDWRGLITYRKYKWLINMSPCLASVENTFNLRLGGIFFFLSETGRLRYNNGFED